MIRPEDIRRKALNLYPEFLRAWLAAEAYFPRTIPANLRLEPGDHAGAKLAITDLREGSKEIRGFGYSVQWRERRSREFGRNVFPVQIAFESQEDFLRYIGKQVEFRAFAASVERLRHEFPPLEDWIRSHRQWLVDIEPDVDGLLQVLRYFRANPRPGRYARELPIPVDTKFIERNERVLRDWFDLVLAPISIRSDEMHFCRRYGLKYAELHVLVRFLDQKLQEELNCPWEELSLPISSLAELPVHDARIWIVENKVNLLTLPPSPRTLAVGALGRAIVELRSLPWLAGLPIFYWGDLDVEGFEILSALRAEFPQARSMLMDVAALANYRHLAVPGTGRKPAIPPHLTPPELHAFSECVGGNLRIEQERIPPSFSLLQEVSI
jgi:hypothetical protein